MWMPRVINCCSTSSTSNCLGMHTAVRNLYYRDFVGLRLEWIAVLVIQGPWVKGWGVALRKATLVPEITRRA